MEFLLNKQLIPYSIENIPNAKTLGVALGKGTTPIEIVVVETNVQPSIPQIREAWKNRQAGRAAPVLLVVNTKDKCSICGPTGENPPILTNVDKSTIERLCNTALEEPDRHSALRFLRSVIENIESPMAGIRNEGLMSSNEIDVWLRDNKGFSEAKIKSIAVRDKRGEDLAASLGYEIDSTTGNASILVSKSNKLALAVFLDRNESPDIANERFSNNSPVTYALTKADQENLKYVIITFGPSIRIYPTDNGVGVGRRGRTETFIELHLDLVKDDTVCLLWDVFSAEAISPDGTFQTILENSKRYSSRLGERLRDRVYNDVIPDLAKGLVKSQNFQNPTQQDLDTTYHMSLTLLFRILFIAYAEDKDLLPYKTNEIYRNNSFKQKSIELVQILENATGFDSNSYSHWEDALRLFDAVNNGNRELGVPQYNGGLFSDSDELSSSGPKLKNLKLPNNVFAPILTNILVDESEEGDIGPVDFRSLGVREFGTIYEGLLESELSIAETDLTIDKNDSFKPTTQEEPVIRSGEVYIHNKSGARKSTGSYFTKAFAVEHLLNHALEPALDKHTARLGTMDDIQASKSFFDFRVADISMGSGHFLIAAVDRIERKLQQYLAERPLPIITNELGRLRISAFNSLGKLNEGVEIEDTTLLRRQIARRCIYGVDLNPIAVELARVSLWIHTFVPGLPLSMLDHHLVVGNSLVGIGTLDEARELVSQAAPGLFGVFVENIIQTAAQRMGKVGALADADASEIQAARGALKEALVNIVPLKAMFDILAASRMDSDISGQIISNISDWQKNPETILTSILHQKVTGVMSGIQLFHFPVAFPDVFTKLRPGFDVILGNPPWEEVTLEELGFWTRHFPGLKGISQREREEIIPNIRNKREDLLVSLEKEIKEKQILSKALMTGPYPGMGTGDPDLYKAFSWRFWQLLKDDGGHLGVVLPRSIWSVKGSEIFRRKVLLEGVIDDLTMLVNNRRWIFEGVHPQYTIALTSLHKGSSKNQSLVATRGPFPTMQAFGEGVKQPPSDLSAQEILSWTNTASIPLLTHSGAAISSEVLRTLKKHPAIGESGHVRPNLELSATADKPLMIFDIEQPHGTWPIYKGGSFDLWSPDKGIKSYYSWGHTNVVNHHLQQKRLKSAKSKNSVFNQYDYDYLENTDTLPSFKPRVVFRDITRATDSRTLRTALIPPNVFLTNTAPYCLIPLGNERDEAFLLGILSSIPLDWYARRVVELHMNFYVFNNLPLPWTQKDHPLRRHIVSISGRLASPDERFAEWAKAVGVEYGPLNQDEKEDMIHELDAAVAHLYGLSEPQLRHIFETFHIGWDYSYRLQETLKHYESLKSKL